tara:strand:- start:152501 stop:153109 length:609 start_codon:yes stop_codon:yes gene_type:complete
MINLLYLLLIPIYFAMAWLFPWKDYQIDSTISISYIWDILFCILVSLLLKTPFKINLNKGFIIRAPLLALMALLCVYIAKWTNLNAPFRYIENLAMQIIILAPLIEELVFRHALYEVIKKSKLKMLFQYILGSLLFSLSHAPAIYYLPADFHGFIYFQLIYTFILGWIIIKARERSDSLLEPIVLHFIFNFIFYLSVKYSLI